MTTEQIEFLTEYDQWKAERRVALGDLSPEAFLIDRAKEQALQKLIKISELMEEFYSLDDVDDEEFSDQMSHLIGGIAQVIED